FYRGWPRIPGLKLFTASWLVPVTSPPDSGGLVAIHDGRVAWTGRADDPGRPAGPRIDLGPGVILPGLVNAHCHLELSHLQGRAPAGSGFVPWVEGLVAERMRADPAEVLPRTAEAIRDLEATGTAAVGDVSNRLEHLDLLAASGLDAVVFYELLSWDPAQAATHLRAALERVGSLAPRGRVRV